MLHRFRIALIVLCTLALVACNNGIVKRVSEPAASLQQLTVRADGNWTVALRLQNFSSMPMTFDDVSLALTVGDNEAGTLHAQPGISIGGTSADVINVDLVPSSAARLVVADALASNRTLARPAHYGVMVVADGYRWIGSDDGVVVEGDTPERLDVGAVRLRRR